MIDWLRREAQEPVIELDGRKLPIQPLRVWCAEVYL